MQQDPAIVETTWAELTDRDQIEQLLVDDDGLYWYDFNGAVWSLPRGEVQPVQLRAPPGGFVGDADPSQPFALVIDGLVSDGQRIYWGEGNAYLGPDIQFELEPPARLFSIAKAGGSPELLLQASDRTLRPVAVHDDRLVVRSGDGFYQLRANAAQLEPLPLRAPATARVVGSALYWTEPDTDRPLLYRAAFDASEPDVVTRIEGNDFDVGPGYVLWRQQREHTAPKLVLDENFAMLDEASACTRALPALGESISFTTALDDQHIYWYSFNKLDSVVVFVDGSAPAPEPPMPLVRVDRNSSVLELLKTPGFELHSPAQIVGQDAAQIYISTYPGLVAVHKP